MANVAANVLVGKPAVTGGVLTGDVGAVTLPTNATTVLDVDLLPAGYISEDGVVQSIGANNTQIKAWGGDIVRTVETEHSVTYQYTMIETNDVSQSEYYGDDNVSGGTVQLKAGDLPHKVRVLEIADGDAKVRIVLPDSQITDRGDITFKDDTAIGYQVTVEAYPDSSGVKAYIYQDGVPVDADDAPVITAVSPATTPAAGGAAVTVTGSRFSTATQVKFGTTNATWFVVVNDHKIVANAPAHSTGAAAITVINPTGTSNAFTFSYT